MSSEQFDPSAHKADEVTEYAAQADEAEKARIIEAEQAGKARKTLLAALTKQEPATTDSDETSPPPRPRKTARWKVTAPLVQAKVGEQVLHFRHGQSLPEGVEETSIKHLQAIGFITKA